jgi:hypothetical protein
MATVLNMEASRDPGQRKFINRCKQYIINALIHIGGILLPIFAANMAATARDPSQWYQEFLRDLVLGAGRITSLNLWRFNPDVLRTGLLIAFVEGYGEAACK